MTWKTDNCKIARNFFDHYINHSLSTTDEQFVREHLSVCKDCKEWFSFADDLQTIGHSESGKLKANPYLYASMMDKIEKKGRQRQLSPLKIGMAASLAVLLGTIFIFPFGQQSKNETTTSSAALIGASSSTHYLLSSLSVDDVLFFWKTGALPVDQTRGEFVVYHQTPQSASIIFTGNPCVECSDDELFETVSASASLNGDQSDNLRQVLTSFADEIRGALLVDRNGQLLVNTELLDSARLLEKEMKTAIPASKFNVFKKQIHALIQDDMTNRSSSFTVHLPQFSDKVAISSENKNHYALITVDEFTVRSLRQSIPKMGRIIMADFTNYPTENYTVVSHNVKLYESGIPETMMAAKIEKPEPKTGLSGLSIIEANEFMTALKRGLTPDEEKRYQTQLSELFTNYSKMSPEARKKIRPSPEDGTYENPSNQQGNANVVGFGNQKTSAQKTKKKNTVSIEHP